MTQYSGPGVTPMAFSAPTHPLIRETPILMETLAEAVGTTPQDVAVHLADTEGDANHTPLAAFIDEYILTS